MLILDPALVCSAVGGFATRLWNKDSAQKSLLACVEGVSCLPDNLVVKWYGIHTLVYCQQHDPGKEVETVDIAASGRLMATGGRDGKIILTTLPTYTQVETIEKRKVRIRVSVSVAWMGGADW